MGVGFVLGVGGNRESKATPASARNCDTVAYLLRNLAAIYGAGTMTQGDIRAAAQRQQCIGPTPEIG